MYSWAQRMHRRAATLGSVVTSCGHPGAQYLHRLEKVKFGVPLEEVCKNDIPGPLLVLILKLNKEAPFRKDVFRAPGNQNAMKKLIHFLQQGRLVNVDNYSVYTIASVLKKFLRKLPGGVFGRDGEAELFQIVDLDDELEQREKIHKLLMSLPGHTQRLLVLLFGTFRVIASNSERADTGMTSEALGVSVAPSFFQSCVSDGKTARMKDVLRFKAEVHVATKIMKQMIEQFTACDLFGRVNYEYYVRVTGRVLRVQDEWICSFRYPPPPRGKTAQQNYALKLALQTEKTWLQCECERWTLIAQEESHSTPALLTTGGPNVHERQAARMRTRSEWFLGARGSSLELCHDGGRGGVGGTNSLIHPPIVTSTPIPGTVGHHPHGIIGTYGSIDNLNDLVVVVVDVNQDCQQQSHTQYSNLHPNHHHHHHQLHHNHAVENHHRSAANLHSRDNPVVQRSPTSEQEFAMLSSQPQHSTSSDNRSSIPHPNEPSATDHAPVHRRSVVEAYAKDSAQDAITEYYSDRSQSTTSEGNDELDGDEHDFAISQGHHFDQRAENRRRRRRRALLRRNSYDQIVSSGSFLPATSVECCRPTNATTSTCKNVSNIAAGGGSGVSSRTLSTSVSVDERGAMNRSARNPSNHHTLSSAEMPPSDASPSNIPSANANASLSRHVASDKHSRPSAIGRNRSNSSVTLRNGSSTSSISRQSNLSTIVFSVLDFLF
ncbi:uncharacterized protein LOC118462552 isoform X5 [Anopheles albimanus]|uniref:uncharacterized protein LOC118462552 isoform X5 n=1 Tax=Anopheles albimanus TaxID=7167 RepID=UPI0016409E15|nr:uncharacterized protein LOC118462552 isoform X5 [Anopheles albimanus]